MSKQEFVIETYHNEKQMQKGRNRMADRGYSVDKMTTDSRTGCMRKIMGGFIFTRPKVYHTVTYQLKPEAANDDKGI